MSLLPEVELPRVLVVDDDAAIRSMLESVLRREKFVVESASDGVEAIENLASNDYATILLDLMMPGVDGLGVLRYIEQQLQRPKPAVIIMTANPQAAASTDTDSVVDILSKPFDIRQLISRVRACAAPSVAGASEAA
ncbi:MAG: response regulator transcription factor [Thermoanaerobaculia bacterium]|nr:response regulator transcription factor [Thermoanaerobaculia bacterium]